MAVIGFVRDEEMEVKNGEEKKIIKWLECHFRIAGLRPFKAKLAKNKNPQGNKSPDFYIYMRANINKGDTFRDIRIGSLWLKNKIDEETKTATQYMTGFLEVGFKQVNILVQKPTKYFEDEKIGFRYEIIAFNDDKNTQNNNNYDDYNYDEYSNTETEIDIPDEDIPF